MNNWYSIKAEGRAVDLSIHDQIGTFGVSPKLLFDELKQHKGVTRINLSIHSPGGSAFDGIAIYNMLKDHPAKVYGRVEGVAASAASIVLMASDVIAMPEDSWLMIHNAWTMAAGNAEELRETADFLDKISSSLVNIYATRTGLEKETIVEMLDEETWLSAAEAQDLGFSDSTEKEMGVAALSRDFAKQFAKLPDALANKKRDIDALDSFKDFETYLRDAGMSRQQATSLACRFKQIVQSESEAVAKSEESAKIHAAMSAISNRFKRTN